MSLAVTTALVFAGFCTISPNAVIADLQSGLQAYWGFDESAGYTAKDSVGGKNGTLNGYGATPGWTAGKLGGALSFDGANDYVQVLNPNVPTDGSARTIAGWVNLDGGSTTNVFLSYGQRYYHQTAAMSIYSTNLNPSFASHGDDLYNFTSITKDTWNLFAVTYDGTTVKLYLNGSYLDSLAVALDTQLYDAGLLIGAHVQVPGDHNYFYNFSGKIDDVGIWNRALTSVEMSDLWNNGNGISLVPVPAPGALVLGLMGFSLIGWVKRRMA